VWCWGSNYWGQLGIGYSYGFSDIPVRVPSLGDVVDLGVGCFASCALRRDGEVLCWGQDQSGILGTGGDWEDEASPVPVVWDDAPP